MSNTLLDVQNLTMKFGGLVAIDDLTFLQKRSHHINYWSEWSWKNYSI